MRIRIYTFLLLLIIGAFSFTTTRLAAQTDAILLDEDYTLALPEGWMLGDETDDGFIFNQDDLRLRVIDPTRLAEAFGSEDIRTIDDALLSAYEILYDETADATTFVDTTFGDFEGRYLPIKTDDRRNGILVVIEADEVVFAAFDLLLPAGGGSTADALTIIEDVIDGFAAIEGETTTTRGTTTAAANTVATEPCTVSVSAANTAALRVGPGFNRASVVFLPASTDVSVTAQSTTDEGDLWYQVDKTEAAPTSAANELWVLADDVTAEGDCDVVPQSAGSAIIPIIPNTTTTTVTGEDTTTTGATTTTTTTVNSSTTPLAGTWTQTFARQSNVSCAGTQNFVVPTEEAWESWDEGDYVYTSTLTPNASGFNFGGQYAATGGNRYIFTVTLEGSFNNYEEWFQTSGTTASGNLVGNAIFDGQACSGSTPFTAVRN